MNKRNTSYPKVVVKKSFAGLGLFAGEKVKKGTRIIEYVGEIISSDEANKRGGRYLFEISKRRTIDGSTRSNTARYINHSCVPNCEAVDDRGRIFIEAKKAIQEGEEFTYDYGKEYVEEYIKDVCSCPKCAGKLK